MKKILSLMMVTGLVLTACGSAEEPEQTPAEVILEATQNGLELTSGEYELTIAMEATSPTEDISFDGTMTGVFDLGEEVMFSLAADANLAMNAGDENLEGNVKAEVRVLEDTIYFLLEDLSDFGGQVPEEAVEGFLGEWQYVESPMPLGDLLGEYMTLAKDSAPTTVEEIEAVYSNLEYDGSEDGNYVYTYEMDNEQLLDLVSSTAGQTVPIDGDVEQLLENATISGKTMIDPDSMLEVGGEFTFTVKDFEGADGGDLDMTITYALENPNEDVDLEVPDDAVEFAFPLF